MVGAMGVGEGILAAYRDLLSAEARLGEMLSPRGIRVGVSLVDQWPTLHEYLNLYARGLSPAGVLVLAGAPDEGSRHTGIPFTGAREARDALGIAATGSASSPSAAAFWRAVAQAQAACADAPLEALFGTLHLAHARPFDFDATAEVREASAQHVRRLLAEARPQAIVCLGPEPLATLGFALADPRIADLAAAPEESWAARYPAGTSLVRYPSVDVPAKMPFRARVIPVPALDGPRSNAGVGALASVLQNAWG